MATFYAKYPATTVATAGTSTVQGPGTAGTPTGGVLTVQGDPAGTPIPISGSITTTPGIIPDTTATGTITSTQSVTVTTDGYATVGVQVTGTFTGTIFVEWSPDGTTFYNTTWASIQTGALSLTFTAAGAGTIQCAGAHQVRLRGSSVASGTATVYLRANATTAQVMIDNPLPTGTNTVGAVNQAGTWNINNVSGTVSLPTGAATAAKQPALGTAGAASADVITVQGIASMTPLLVTQSGTGSTQPTNVAQFGGSNVVTGTGTGGSGIPRVTVSSDSTVGVSSIAPVTTSTATFQAEGSLAFGSITSAYQTVFTPASATKILQMRNNTDASISVSFDAGTTLNYVLDAGDQVSLDLLSNALAMSTTAIQIKYTSGAPTSGSFRVNGAH